MVLAGGVEPGKSEPPSGPGPKAVAGQQLSLSSRTCPAEQATAFASVGDKIATPAVNSATRIQAPTSCFIVSPDHQTKKDPRSDEIQAHDSAARTERTRHATRWQT